jgi:hypothetical protein
MGACIPDGQGGRTLKFATVLKQAYVCSATNVGLTILIRPNASLDGHSVQFLERDDTAPFNLVGAATCVNGIAKGAPFLSTEYANGNLEQRLVSWGCKVRGIGAPLTANGIQYGYVTPSGSSIATNTTPFHLSSQANTRRSLVSEHRELRVQHALETYDKQAPYYSSANYLQLGLDINTDTTPSVLQTFIGFIYIPPQGTGIKTAIDLDYVAHWEVRGRLATAMGGEAPAGNDGIASGIFGRYMGYARGMASNLSTALPTYKTVSELMQAANFASGGLLQATVNNMAAQHMRSAKLKTLTL